MPCRLCILAMLLIVASTAEAQPDFYVEPIECQMLIGYLNDGSLKVLEADPPYYECVRRGREITCSVRFESGGRGRKGDTQTFRVLIDSPPILAFGIENGAEFFYIDTSKNSAVVTSRRAELEWHGHKVCTAMFATHDQLKALRQLLKERRR